MEHSSTENSFNVKAYKFSEDKGNQGKSTINNKTKSLSSTDIETNHQLSMIDLHKTSKILNSKLYIYLSKLMHSRQCFYYYMFLMVFSILLFIYSVFALLYDLGKDSNL